MNSTEKMNLEDFTQYDDFEAKFKAKKTTDDCYTPGPVYEAIKDWAVERYRLEGREIVRPFYPGGDYERFRYPPGCVVLDNPPFSILARIEAFYLREGIDFFLFAPGLSLFKPEPELGYVVTDLAIRYENGAEVPTSFVTNLGDAWVETAPALSQAVRELQKKDKAQARYEYPPEIITAAKLRYIDGKGVEFSLPRKTPREFLRKIDANKSKGIFGAGFLVNKKTAAAQAAAQAKVFALSPREKALVELLGREQEEDGSFDFAQDDRRNV